MRTSALLQPGESPLGGAEAPISSRVRGLYRRPRRAGSGRTPSAAVPVTGSSPVRAASGRSASALRAGSSTVAHRVGRGAGSLNGPVSTSNNFGATATESASGFGASRSACSTSRAASPMRTRIRLRCGFRRGSGAVARLRGLPDELSLDRIRCLLASAEDIAVSPPTQQTLAAIQQGDRVAAPPPGARVPLSHHRRHDAVRKARRHRDRFARRRQHREQHAGGASARGTPRTRPGAGPRRALAAASPSSARLDPLDGRAAFRRHRFVFGVS